MLYSLPLSYTFSLSPPNPTWKATATHDVCLVASQEWSGVRFLNKHFPVLVAMYSVVSIWPGQNSWALRRCKWIELPWLTQSYADLHQLKGCIHPQFFPSSSAAFHWCMVMSIRINVMAMLHPVSEHLLCRQVFKVMSVDFKGYTA